MNTIINKNNVDFDKIYHFGKEDPKFNHIYGNRAIRPAHIKKMANSIKTGKYGNKYFSPIEVNINDYGIADGQNRYAAIEYLWENGWDGKVAVIFVDYPANKEETVQIIKDKNTSQKSWNNKDFTYSLKECGNESALALEQFAITHDLCHNTRKNGSLGALKLSYASAFLKGYRVEMKKPFIITPEDVQFAEILYTEVEAMMKMTQWPMETWFERFVRAWYAVRNDTPFINYFAEIGGVEKFLKYLEEEKYYEDWEICDVQGFRSQFNNAIFKCWKKHKQIY